MGRKKFVICACALIGLGFLAMMPPTTPAEAIRPAFHYGHVIIIQFSEICQKMLKYNTSSACPSLEKLIKYDTSNKNISGKFIDKNGTWTRTKPQILNHYKFYTKDAVCVDCSFLPDMVQTIIIEPRSFTWADPLEKPVNGNLVSHRDRFVSLGCLTANLPYNDTILNDTISYMFSGCVTTSFNNNDTIKQKSTPADYDSPNVLKYKAWLAKIKKLNFGDCIHKKCNIPDLFRNW